MKTRRSVRILRRAVQLLFFAIVLLVVLAHTFEENGNPLPFLKGASLHAICPFGGVVTLYQFLTSGTFVQKIHQSSLYLMFLVLGTVILAGPLFCGWVCPFGTFQEWISKIGRRIFGKRFNRMVPPKVDAILRYLRYVVLIWVVIVTATSARLVFSDYDPYYALFNFWTGEVALGAFISLGIVMVLSLFVERPFCKYACPYGALLGVTNLFRIFSIRRNTKTCISCNKCDKSCPMNLAIADKKLVRNHQCISCLECTSEAACPVEATLELATKQTSTTVKEEVAS